MIHKSSIISPKAKISKNVKIGPFCFIGANVHIKENVELISNVHIEGKTTIGKGTKIFPFASIGTQPQDLKYNDEANSLEIGENNLIREYVTINPGTAGGGGKTAFGLPYTLLVDSSNPQLPVPANDSARDLDLSNLAAGGKMKYKVVGLCVPTNEIVTVKSKWSRIEE